MNISNERDATYKSARKTPMPVGYPEARTVKSKPVAVKSKKNKKFKKTIDN